MKEIIETSKGDPKRGGFLMIFMSDSVHLIDPRLDSTPITINTDTNKDFVLTVSSEEETEAQLIRKTNGKHQVIESSQS